VSADRQLTHRAPTALSVNTLPSVSRQHRQWSVSPTTPSHEIIISHSSSWVGVLVSCAADICVDIDGEDIVNAMQKK